MVSHGCSISRTLLLLNLTTSALIWLIVLPLPAQQSPRVPTPTPNKYIFLLPEGFKGWVCVDFEVAGAPPLPREGDAQVIRPRQGEVLATSDKALPTFLDGKAWFEIKGKRKPLPKNVMLQPVVSRSGPREPTERQCSFVGTEDEKERASAAPGFERSYRTPGSIPIAERQALEALYKATDGDHWTHRVGWLGASGTECDWHGVQCAPGDNGSMNVFELDLFDNNLNGTIPNDIAQLTKLDSIEFSENRLKGPIPSALERLENLNDLRLRGNHFSGMLPSRLIQRARAGNLTIVAETPLLIDISEIDFESSASALLCARDRIIIRSDDTITSYSVRCRSATPDDRTTFCEVKEGRVLRGLVGLGWLVEQDGFFDMNEQYERSITDAGFENTRVTREGTAHAVSSYAGAGPFELWVIDRAIEGVASSVDWKKTTTQPRCPRW
jgi:hypothetical protein